MIYHFKNNITHAKGKIIEDKVNYFADYFEFSFSNWGNCHVPEIENHRSLLEKVLFQLENYTKYSSKYINHFFSNKLLSKKDPTIKRFYGKEWNKIILLQNKLNNYADLNIRLKAIFDLKNFINLLDKTLFENTINSLVNVFACKFPLEGHQHIEAIEYITSIILAEFFYAGFTKEDLRQIFKRIFENRIFIKNGKPETKIPLPADLHELKYKNPVLFFEKVSKHLKNRHLQQQFLGIYNFYKNEQKEKTFIYKIEYIKSQTRVNWNYDKVLFSNKLSKTLSKKTTRKEYADFFSDKEVLLAKVSVTGINDNSAKINAIREVNNSLLLLNFVCKSNAIINPIEFIVRDRDSDFLHKYFNTYIQEEHKKEFNDSNIFYVLKNYNTDLAIKLKNFDSIFINGYASIYKDIKLVNLWRYLACFFNEKTIPIQANQVIANYYSGHSKGYYVHVLRQIFDSYNNPQVFDKLNKEEKSEIFTLMKESFIKKINLKRFSELANHPYLNRELKQYLQKTIKEKIELVKDFYEKILFEAYEQRNLIQHSGTFHEKSVDKILMSLMPAAIIIRAELIRCVKNPKFKTFNDVIVSLLKTPRSW
jgi:hypothetical protein